MFSQWTSLLDLVQVALKHHRHSFLTTAVNNAIEVESKKQKEQRERTEQKERDGVEDGEMDVVELEDEKVNDEEEGRRVECIVGDNEEEDEEREQQDEKQPEKKRNARKRKTSSTAHFDLSQSQSPPPLSSSSSSSATVAKRAERAAEKEWDAMYTYCRLVTTTQRVAPHRTALHPFRSNRLLEFISLLSESRTSLHIKSLYMPPHHTMPHHIT